MAGVETTVISRPQDNAKKFKVIVVGLDENSDFSETFDFGARKEDWMPTKFMITTVQTAGTTAVVDVALQGSNDESDWEDLCTSTNCETGVHIHGPAVNRNASDTQQDKSFDFFRIFVTTVGAGNTLTATGYLYNPN